MKTLAFILGIPLLIGIVIWILQSLANPTSPEVIERAGELMAQAAILWWIPVLQFLLSIPIFGSILAVVFLFLLARSDSAG